MPKTSKEKNGDDNSPSVSAEYLRPPIDLLETRAASSDAQGEDHSARIEIIKNVFKSFRLNVEPQGYRQGAAFTRYEFKMPEGINIKKALNYVDDVQMKLSVKGRVRIVAPIPGKKLIGVEVPNEKQAVVGLKEVLENADRSKEKAGGISFAVGKDVTGEAITDDISCAPHYLIAGMTGSGKTVFLNALIVSTVMRYSPEEVRFILVNTKDAGFDKFAALPHLLAGGVITEPKKALSLLQLMYDEMERRYEEFINCGEPVYDITDYNEFAVKNAKRKMPRIIFVADEMESLMKGMSGKFQNQVMKVAMKARAAGIHLVLATQKASPNVITGMLKANIPSRVAFKTASSAESCLIMSEYGAERLSGKGEMLYRNTRMFEPERYQGAFVSEKEIEKIVAYINEHNARNAYDELNDRFSKE